MEDTNNDQQVSEDTARANGDGLGTDSPIASLTATPVDTSIPAAAAPDVPVSQISVLATDPGEPSVTSDDAGVNESTEQTEQPAERPNYPDSCGMCRFWLQDGFGSMQGLCRRGPPKVFLLPKSEGGGFISQFPPMRAEGWCGEFKEAPDKDQRQFLPPVVQQQEIPVDLNLGNVSPLGHREPNNSKNQKNRNKNRR